MSKSELDQKLRHRIQFHSFLGVFNFVRKKNEKLPLIKWLFMTISGHFSASYIEIFHKTEVQTVILRCLVCLNLNWIQSYNIILVKNSFFSCLKMHHFSGVLPKWVLLHQMEISCHFFKLALFSKFFGDLISHMIREYADKEIK